MFSFPASSFLSGTRCTMTTLLRPTWNIQSSLLKVSPETRISSVRVHVFAVKSPGLGGEELKLGENSLQQMSGDALLLLLLSSDVLLLLLIFHYNGRLWQSLVYILLYPFIRASNVLRKLPHLASCYRDLNRLCSGLPEGGGSSPWRSGSSIRPW